MTPNIPPNKKSENLRLAAAYAAHLVALLELGKEGVIEIKQEHNFAPIYLRRKFGAEMAGDDFPKSLPTPADMVQ